MNKINKLPIIENKWPALSTWQSAGVLLLVLLPAVVLLEFPVPWIICINFCMIEIGKQCIYIYIYLLKNIIGKYSESENIVVLLECLVL